MSTRKVRGRSHSCYLLIGHIKEYPTMHCFGIPVHTQSMIQDLTVFWDLQPKIALWEFCQDALSVLFHGKRSTSLVELKPCLLVCQLVDFCQQKFVALFGEFCLTPNPQDERSPQVTLKIKTLTFSLTSIFFLSSSFSRGTLYIINSLQSGSSCVGFLSRFKSLSIFRSLMNLISDISITCAIRLQSSIVWVCRLFQ